MPPSLPYRASNPNDQVEAFAAPRKEEPAWQAQTLPSLDLESFFALLLRWKWLILLATAAATALALAYLKIAPRLFESQGRLEIGIQDVNVSKFDPFQRVDFGPIDALKTVEAMLSSNTLVDKMITSHDLAKHFQGSRTAMIGQILGGSRVELVKGTRIVQISFRHPDPKIAKTVVDAYLAAYPAWETERKQGVAKLAKSDLESQALRLDAELTETRKALEAFRKANPGFSEKEDSESLVSSEQALTTAITNRTKLEADLKGMQPGQVPRAESLMRMPSIAMREEVRDLQAKISDAESAFSTLQDGNRTLRVFEGKYLYKHEKYRAADSKLAGLMQRLEGALRTAYSGLERDLQAAKTTEEKLRIEVEKKRVRTTEMETDRENFARLKSKVTEKESLLTSLRTRIGEASVAAEIVANNIKVAQEPMVAEGPVTPKKKLILVGGMLLGLISGLGMAIGLQLMDRKIHCIDDVERIMPGIPCLAEVPLSAKAFGEEKLVFINQPHSAASEAFRGLRTSLSLLRPGSEPRSIVFTSASPGEGKSHCAINTAAAYAMQGQQTLLIEADLRCPSLEAVFLRGQNRGLSSYLRGAAAPHEICYGTSIQNLFFIPAGELRPNPSELLAGTAMTELLTTAAEYFQKIIIDTPPLGAVSDALLPACLSDVVCLVVRANGTTRQSLHQVAKQLAQVGRPATGYVMNGQARSQSDRTYSNYLNHQTSRLSLAESGRTTHPVVIEALPNPSITSKAALL